MKTLIVSLFTLLSWIPQQVHAQIIYSEAAGVLGIDHQYGSGAPGGGISFCDFNQDGMDDLTLGGVAGQGIEFYLNDSGVFQRMAPLADVPCEVKQILWVDYDNDGDKDLYSACYDGYNRLFSNRGNLVLVEVTEDAGLPTEIHRGFGALFVDFNRDGWLDLYYVKRRLGTDSLTNENRLFLNHPSGVFTEVTDEAGVADRGKKPFCAVAIDYDNDKWPDIYINNDKQTINTLLHNNGDGSFSDVGEACNANVQMDAMGTALGDYNNDGWMDMYVSNIPTGNVLLHNNGPDTAGNYTFTDKALESNTIFNSVAWGTNFLDADNDGDLDLYVSSMLSGEAQINSTLYENLGNGTFQNREGELVGDTCVSFSNAIGDANGDGIADIAVVNQGDFSSQLWISMPPLIPNRFLKIRLEGRLSNRDGIGARIETWAGGSYQQRYTHCGIGFLGQNSNTEIIGFNVLSAVDSIVITWPTGHIDRLYDVATEQTIEVIEGSTTDGHIMVDPDITIVTSTYDVKEERALVITPNPTMHEIRINDASSSTYKIINTMGKVVGSGFIRQANEEISVDQLTPGIYVIWLNRNGKTASGLFVKQ